MRIEREIDVNSALRKNLIFRRWQSAGERIPSRIDRVRLGQSAGRAGYRDAVAPWWSVRVLGVEEGVGPVEEDTVRTAQTRPAVAARIPGDAHPWSEFIVLIIDVAVRHSGIAVEE